MKSRIAVLHDLFVSSQTKGNEWKSPSSGSVDAVINEHELGNRLKKPISALQFKKSMPEVKKMIEEQSDYMFTIVEKRDSTDKRGTVIAYRVAQFGDGKRLKETFSIKRKQVKTIVENMKQTNMVVAKNTKLIADNQLNFLQLL